jgi:predicted TIM-barrel fold metal-dependent hydrolase
VLLPDFTYALKGGLLTIAEMYREHATILAQYPGRFFVFAGPDPRWGKDGFDLFVKGIEEYGFTGLKIYPPCGYRPNADVLKPFYEYCNEHSLPVLMHTGPTSPVLSFTEAHPSYVDEPARKYENISFILAHGAANYQEECINLCRYRRNVYLDLSGAQQLALDARSAPEFVRVFTKGINHKVIFGTDWPINHHPHLNRKFVEMLWKPGQANGYLSERDAELVLGGNLRHILSLSKLKRSAADHSAASNGAPRSVEATPS